MRRAVDRKLLGYDQVDLTATHWAAVCVRRLVLASVPYADDTVYPALASKPDESPKPLDAYLTRSCPTPRTTRRDSR